MAMAGLCPECIREVTDREEIEEESTLCSICLQRPGKVYENLDRGLYCAVCVGVRAQELGVTLNPNALQALAFLTQLQERLNEVQNVLQERVCMLNEDVTGYVHQRSEYCLQLLQSETARTQQRYSMLMTRLQQLPMNPNDDDDEAMDQVRIPGLLKSLSSMVLHRVNIQAPAVNQAMTQALMGRFVFFSDIVEIVEFRQRSEDREEDLERAPEQED